MGYSVASVNENMGDSERIFDNTNRNEGETTFSMLPVSDEGKEKSKKLKISNNRGELDDRQQQCSNDTNSHSESPWNIIIVNQIPWGFDPDKFTTIFSEYGEIVDCYHSGEFARITFETEEGARKVWEASQERPFRYNDDVVAITLFSEDYCPIESLPVDCLVQILLRVDDVKDKLTLESVSHRWKTLSKQSWTNFTEVHFNHSLDNSIMTRAKNHLRTVGLSLWNYEDVQSLKELARNCTRLEKFKGSFGLSDNNGSRAVSELDEALKSLLRANSHLRQLSLHIADGVVFKIDFNNTNLSQLEYLHIVQDTDTGEIFRGNVDLSCYRNLQVLILRGRPTKVTFEVKGLDTLVHLKTLALEDYNLSYFPDIEKIKSLENLLLPHCIGTDDQLKRILQNNKKLKCLDIEGSAYITDESFKYIQQLPELKLLNMVSVQLVTDKYFAHMPTVETVYAINCRITDSGVEQFLNTASEISDLTISHTDVTSECISIAHNWTKRTGKKLNLYVSDDVHYDRRAYSGSKLAICRARSWANPFFMFI